MDLSLARDLFESFFLYQDRLTKEFEWMSAQYSFHRVDANRVPEQVHAEVQRLVAPLYGIRTAAPVRPIRRPAASG